MSLSSMYSYLLANDCTSRYGLLKVHALVKTDLLKKNNSSGWSTSKTEYIYFDFLFFHNTDMMTISNFTIHSWYNPCNRSWFEHRCISKQNSSGLRFTNQPLATVVSSYLVFFKIRNSKLCNKTFTKCVSLKNGILGI